MEGKALRNLLATQISCNILTVVVPFVGANVVVDVDGTLMRWASGFGSCSRAAMTNTTIVTINTSNICR